MSSRRKKKKLNRQQRKQSTTKRLRRRVQQRFPDHQIVSEDTNDGVKMSEVIEAFAQPYLRLAETKEEYSKVIALALVAWNAALFPDKGIDGMLQAIPASVRQDGRELIEAMIKRKHAHFTDYKRMVVDYEVTAARTGYHLSVMSTQT